MPPVVEILKLLRLGIGVHHSGLLPILKELVELLFQEQLIKVGKGCGISRVASRPEIRVGPSMLSLEELVELLFQEQLIKAGKGCVTSRVASRPELRV